MEGNDNVRIEKEVKKRKSAKTVLLCLGGFICERITEEENVCNGDVLRSRSEYAAYGYHGAAGCRKRFGGGLMYLKKHREIRISLIMRMKVWKKI